LIISCYFNYIAGNFREKFRKISQQIRYLKFGVHNCFGGFLLKGSLEINYIENSCTKYIYKF